MKYSFPSFVACIQGSKYISLMRNIFLIPDDAVDRQKLGFYHFTILQ